MSWFRTHVYSNKEPYRKGVWIHRRLHIWIYPAEGDKNEIASWGFEWLLQKLKFEFAWVFHVGNLGSETPWDGHLTFLGQSFFWNFSRGRHFAHFLTNGRKERSYASKDLSLRIFSGSLWWNVWSDPNEHTASKKRKDGKYKKSRFPQGNVSIDPRVWLFGTLSYSYEDLDRWVGAVDFEEGSYPVVLTVQAVRRGRKRRRNHPIVSRCVDVDAPRGVPTHFDKSGGWKGDRTYGWSVDWPYSGVHSEWYIDAKRLVEAWVLKERGRTGFREAQKEDAE